MITITALTAGVVACKKKDSDNSKDPEGTITLSVRNWNNGRTGVCPQECRGCFYISSDDNFFDIWQYDWYEWQFASVGSVSGLGAVKQIPASGWAASVAVIPGHGYVGKCASKEYSNGQLEVVSTTYVRFYVKSYVISATSGGVMGADIKYQSPFVP